MDTHTPVSKELVIKNPYLLERPQWHAPWKLMRVLSGHWGWVRSIAVDVSNEWFCTGAGIEIEKERNREREREREREIER